jgi:carbonic anhydrase
MNVIDGLLERNEQYAASFDKGDLAKAPAKRLAVLACMDARIQVSKILGLEEGDAHIIRNAGGVVTDDAIRSLAISQRLLGTKEIILISHTDCGMLTFTDGDFRQQLKEATGEEPGWSAEAFDDLDHNLLDSIEKIKSNPFIPHSDNVRGFIYEIESGRLRELDA